MATFAPEFPTIEQLHERHPLNELDQHAIADSRLILSELYSGKRYGFAANLGPCAMTLARAIIDQEGNVLHEAQDPDNGFITLHRIPPWKPRSRLQDWHGLESVPETTERAFRTIAERASASANVASEIGHILHLARYGKYLTMGWIGSRNVENDELVGEAAIYDITLTLGIKNGMDGNIDSAVRQVKRINDLRGGDGAPAILIYRAGSNVLTPEAWEYGYRDALDRTDGMMVLDTAHGGEIAHYRDEYAQDDGQRISKKTVGGQIECAQHAIRIGEMHGETPVSVMSEASSAASPTDPVRPFDGALEDAKTLHNLRMSMLTPVS